ncbi:Cellulose binding domain-containing protein [Nocardiopsis flavescens]|uniref:Cellulose binding domain-containing protein n=1 Tax=Nocardiopsis flavescens TaxID=758803 RepID=A0A1M6N1B3_9ACTN|nr:cellulose binding domain-containing protein [Nocardiopsis flavescens]SHJ89509.1 Cellulose binding domain-containing protein [Nocardiopsis flavescens]
MPPRTPRPRHRTPAALLSAAALALPLAAVGAAAPSPALAQADYAWDNVRIAGGGFVPGIVFNETEPGLAYARTDIGGAYRLDPATDRWVPLLDWVDWDRWGWTGVVSIATDPVDPDRVYAAVGTYTNDWDPNNGAVLRSDDRGETWEAAELPFKLGGNMPGRGLGERLAVDPNDNSVVYFGARGGHGLWRSTDHGATWSEVTAFPNPGDYVQDPGDPNGLLDDVIGVTWVAFDPGTGSPGSPTQEIYAGVADLDDPLYRSTDGGDTWEPVPGAPTGYLPAHGVVDHGNDRLYVATTSTPGPYDGDAGQVWRLDTGTGEWTDISPVPAGTEDAYFGYGGLTVDRQDPDTLMVATQISWWPDTQIFRSTDAGQTWTRAWDWGAYPERTTRYEMDISTAPWLDWGSAGTAPETQPKLGWMTQAMAIDPFDSDRFLYGTGATVYGSDELTNWDSDTPFTIEVKAHGIEETAVNDLVSPPGDGAPLHSALLDLGGFTHEDLGTVPDRMFDQPAWDHGSSLDFAELAPDTLVRTGGGEEGGSLGVSTNGGDSWWAGQTPGGVTGGGTVAVNADGSRIVWSPDGTGVHVSTTLGSSWSPSSGLPAGARVEADRVDPDVFYAVSGGTFYTSTDGGAVFEARHDGLPAEGNIRFGAAPGHTGDVWVAGGTGDHYGMWRTTDAGETFAAVAGVDEGDAVGFGAPAPGAGYPAVYTSSRIDGVRGIFRSDDAGLSWVRINDDRHQWAWTGAVVTGDPDVYGRVYIGTNGRGIVYGDPAGSGPGTGEPTPEPTEEPTGEPTEEPTEGPTEGPGTADCTWDYTVDNTWPGGFQARVTVTNGGAREVDGWDLAWDFTAGEEITSLWNATHRQDGASVVVSDSGWNARIAPGGSVTVGFNGSADGDPGTPRALSLNGEACG